jgi:hypothetical protein
VAKAQDTSPSTASTGSTPAVGSASNPVASGGRLVVSQKGTLGNNVLYLRIERADASTEVEQAFHAGAISLDTQLAQGKYRVISWGRACDGTCPTSGEIGLGPLANVCGRVVHISSGQTTRVEVAINPDGSCAISKSA